MLALFIYLSGAIVTLAALAVIRQPGRALGTLVGALVLSGMLTAVYLIAERPNPPSPPATILASWADAGRALSTYGARHREVHALLRTRAELVGQASRQP